MRIVAFAFLLGLSVIFPAEASPSLPEQGRPQAKSLLAVLCYHNIDLASPKDSPYSVTSAQLAAEITALKGAGFEFVSLERVDEFYALGKPLPAKSALITFDDGHQNIYEHAYPLLKSMKIPWALFIFPTGIGRGHEKGFMNWDEVRKLNKEGVAIGSHSLDHPFLTKPTGAAATLDGYSAWLDKELQYSKSLIEKQLGSKVRAFAAPFGALNATVQRHIEDAGYSLAFNVFGSNNDGLSDPLELNRFIVLAKDSPEAIVKKAEERPLHFGGSSPGSLQVFTGLLSSISFSLDGAEEYQPGSIRAIVNGTKLDALRGDGSSFTAPFPPPDRSKGYIVTVYATDKTGEPCSQSYFFLYAKEYPAFLPPTFGML